MPSPFTELRRLLPLLAAACAAEPDPCAPMCEAAADAYAACLEGWGADWPAAGYEDRADYVDRCATWAWEMRLLADEAAVDATCERRAADLAGAEDPCAAWQAIDWDTVPQ